MYHARCTMLSPLPVEGVQDGVGPSLHLSRRAALTKYRVRVRSGLNCGTTCSGDPLGRETKRASLGASASERAALPPCRLAVCARNGPPVRASGERRPRRSAQSAGTRRPRRPPMEARVRRRGTCTPPNRLPRRRRRQQPRTRVRVAGPGEAEHGTRARG